jgi:hypothetical protein
MNKSTTGWTPEPWGIEELQDAAGKRAVRITAFDPEDSETPWYVAEMVPDAAYEGEPICSNAARAVACVNALAGIACPEAVPQVIEAARVAIAELNAELAGECGSDWADRFPCTYRALEHFTDALAALDGAK